MHIQSYVSHVPCSDEKEFESLGPLQERHGGLHDSRFRARHDVLATLKQKALSVIRNEKNKGRKLEN